MTNARRILKFVVDSDPNGTIIDTANSPQFLAVGAQGKDIVVWVAAVAGTGVRTRLWGLMTGNPFPDRPLNILYVGTATTTDGIVVHVFARTPDATD